MALSCPLPPPPRQNLVEQLISQLVFEKRARITLKTHRPPDVEEILPPSKRQKLDAPTVQELVDALPFESTEKVNVALEEEESNGEAKEPIKAAPRNGSLVFVTECIIQDAKMRGTRPILFDDLRGHLCDTYGIPRRRIYDVTCILEGFGFVRCSGENKFRSVVVYTEKFIDFIQLVEIMDVERVLDKRIQTLQEQLNSLERDPNLYLDKASIASVCDQPIERIVGKARLQLINERELVLEAMDEDLSSM